MFLLDLKLDPFELIPSLDRFGIWATAWAAIKSQPLFGYGLGNFETAYHLFHHPSRQILHYSQSTIFAHNGVLQVASETGLPGLFLLSWGFWGLTKNLRRHSEQQKTLISIVLVFLVTSLFNYSLFLPFSGFIFSIALGFLARLSLSHESKVKKIDIARYKLVPASVVVLMSIFLVSYGLADKALAQERYERAIELCPLRSDAWYQLALRELNQGKDGAPFIERALQLNPQNAFYWQRMALALIHYHPTQVDSILASFSHAQALAPYHAPFYIQEGFYFLGRKDYAKASELFSHAASLEPAAPLPHYGLYLTALKQKDKQTADNELKMVQSLKQDQQKLFEDPQFGVANQNNFSSAYAQFLFDVNHN